MTKSSHVHFVKEHPDAVLPCKAHDGDAGFDLYSVENVVLSPHSTIPISIGLKLAELSTPNSNSFIKIEGRSGLAAKYGIFPIGGIVDANYRGEIKVVLHNGSMNEYEIKKGDKVAQMLIYKILCGTDEISVQFTNEVSETTRGQNGFGSSGK